MIISQNSDNILKRNGLSIDKYCIEIGFFMNDRIFFYLKNGWEINYIMTGYKNLSDTLNKYVQ